MDLTNVMWGEGSQVRVILYCMVPFVEKSRKCKPMSDGKQIDSAWGRGWRGCNVWSPGHGWGHGVQTPAQTHSTVHVHQDDDC